MPTYIALLIDEISLMFLSPLGPAVPGISDLMICYFRYGVCYRL